MRWIGVDLSGKTFRAADSNGLEISEEVFKAEHKCGCRVEASLPADSIFTEHVTVPESVGDDIERFLPGLLDVAIPVPVEDCLVVAGPSSETMALGFAIRRDDYRHRINAFAERAGCTPERVAPAPLALWKKVVQDCATNGNSPVLLHLHAAPDAWTLLSGNAASAKCHLPIPLVATVPAGDVRAALRNFGIFLSRLGVTQGHLTISGDEASTDLANALKALADDSKPVVVGNPRHYLATALAIDGEKSQNSTSGSFARDEFEHPALTNRRFHYHMAALLLPFAASVVFLFSSAYYKMRTSSALDEFERRTSSVAESLAGRKLPYKGAAALRAACNEFASRRSQSILAFAEPRPIDAIDDIIAFASGRDAKIASFSYDGSIMNVSGRVAAEVDIDVLISNLESAGWTVERSSEPTVPMSFALAISKGVDADE